jgi:hypothetical protein
MSGGARCLFCSTRRFRNANSTPLISISRHLAPFNELGWKVITLKGLFQSSAEEYFENPGKRSLAIYKYSIALKKIVFRHECPLSSQVPRRVLQSTSRRQELLNFLCKIMNEYWVSGSFPKGDIASGALPNLAMPTTK